MTIESSGIARSGSSGMRRYAGLCKVFQTLESFTAADILIFDVTLSTQVTGRQPTS